LQTLFIFSLILIGSLEIMDKLVEEGVLSKIGKESYAVNKDKVDFLLKLTFTLTHFHCSSTPFPFQPLSDEIAMSEP